MTRLIFLLYRAAVFFQFWRTIVDTKKRPYLRRFWICNNRWFGVFIHQILRSDAERECHDHPWDFTSVILWGSYDEFNLRRDFAPDGRYALCEEKRTYRRGAVVHHMAEDAHRLEIPDGKTTWTLVICGKTRREWGFYFHDGTWVPHHQYLNLKFGAGNWTEV